MLGDTLEAARIQPGRRRLDRTDDLAPGLWAWAVRSVNAALAQLTENAAILEGVGALFRAFPDHPNHDAE